MIEEQEQSCNSDITVICASTAPYRIPSPPPALRIPPPACAKPTKKKDDNFCRVPLPPQGARVPGDRIVWQPMEFIKTDIIEEKTDIHGPDLTESLLSSAHVPSCSEISPDPEPNKNLAIIVLEDSLTQQLLALPDSTSVVEIEFQKNQLSSTLELEEEAEITSMAQLPQIHLEGDSINLNDLAEMLEIKPYKVLRDLIIRKISLESADWIPVDTANEIASRYGLEFVAGYSGSLFKFPDRNRFHVKSGMIVYPGNWVIDSSLGLGRILKLNSGTQSIDEHLVWFAELKKKSKIVGNHSLRPTTLEKINDSMVPEHIRKIAPAVK